MSTSVESTDCIDGSTVHVARDANSYMDQEKYSAVAMQQEDNGRSGGSSDNVNNTGSKKGYHSNHTWLIHYSDMCSYEVSGKYMYINFYSACKITCTVSKQQPAITTPTNARNTPVLMFWVHNAFL